MNYEEKILTYLVDNYRKSKKDSGDNKTNRRTQVKPEKMYKKYNANDGDFEEISKFNQAVEHLSKLGFIRSVKETFGTQIQCIFLVDECIQEAEQYLAEKCGYVSKDMQIEKLRNLVGKYKNASPICEKECARLLESIVERKVPKNIDELDDVLKPISEIKNDMYVGMDIGRKKDLTVIWVLEQMENIFYTRSVIELHKMPFHKQEEILSEVLSCKKFRRCCPDSTGIGMQLSENAQIKFGKYRVEPIMFTNRIKEELAYALRTHFEDRTIFIPKKHEIREDLHSVRRITTTANNIRFDADHSENGHADRFWALALALHAAGNGSGDINISTRKRYETLKLVEGF